MTRQQKRAFRDYVAAWIKRLDRSIKLGQRAPGNYVVKRDGV